MTESPLHFELPETVTVKKFLAKLGKKIDVQIISQQHSIKTFYDSFDWRLYNSGIICEFNQLKEASNLRLIDRKTQKIMALGELPVVPQFAGQCGHYPLNKLLEPVLEMRALSPLTSLSLDVYRICILNNDKKIILRLQIDEFEGIANYMTLYPLKGYEKSVIKVGNILQKRLGLKQAQCGVLDAALKQIGRELQGYSSKVAIKLNPDMYAGEACIIIYKHLLGAMQANEAGTIADIDSEFLHDFRVAIRRTRAGLSQIKNTLPASDVAKYAEFFAWLGEITSLTRDLDVYLLSYKHYQSILPVSLHKDLDPLYDFLKRKQVQAQKELAEKLQSTRYKKQLLAWEHFLAQPLSKKGKRKDGRIAIKELADQRIWKAYQRLLKNGHSINDASPPESLHDLRKVCKKLRYLMEFFQSLYAEGKIKRSIKVLKNFQTVLGDFQDYEVQENSIKHFSEEMMCQNVAANTLLAMGVLVQHLDIMKCRAREGFAEQFSLFKQVDNQVVFQTLFNSRKNN